MIPEKQCPNTSFSSYCQFCIQLDKGNACLFGVGKAWVFLARDSIHAFKLFCLFSLNIAFLARVLVLFLHLRNTLFSSYIFLQACICEPYLKIHRIKALCLSWPMSSLDTSQAFQWFFMPSLGVKAQLLYSRERKPSKDSSGNRTSPLVICCTFIGIF